MKRLLLALLLIVVFCLGLAVSFYNSGTVSFDYLAGRIEFPLIGLLVCGFAFGMLVSGVLNLATNWSLRRDTRRLQRQLNATEVELRTLRHLPLAGAGPTPTAEAAKPPKPNEAKNA